MGADKIGAVIVAYNPDLEELKLSVTAALKQVDCLVLVNNGKDTLNGFIEYLPESFASRFNIIENMANLGVAKALNIGITFLITSGCSYMVFLDQDSLIPKDMVSMLHVSFVKMRLAGSKIAAIGPSFFDKSLDKISPFIRFKKIYGYDYIFASELVPITHTHLLITSGTFTSVDVLSDVGLLDDNLFIDAVDHEWCLRAISKGYGVFGDGNVIMRHSIGDNPIIFLKQKFHKHSALRHYYIARNAVHLFRRKYIPFSWRLSMLSTAIKLFIFYSIIPPNRFENFTMMLKGFYHGIAGKYGRYDLI